jgi:hypothetical protein
MSYASVVGMNNQQLRITGVAEFFREGFVADLCARFEECARENEEELDGDTISIHWSDCAAFPPLELLRPYILNRPRLRWM